MLKDNRGQTNSMSSIIKVVVAVSIGLFVAGALALPALDFFESEEYELGDDVEAIVELIPLLGALAIAVGFLIVVMRGINSAT